MQPDRNVAVLAAALLSRPWAIDRRSLAKVIETLRVRSEAMRQMTTADIDAAVQAAALTPLGRMVGAVAVIPVSGVITQKADFYSWWYGGTSVERLTASFRQYLNDPAVSTIVFDVDSPGGEVYGVPEFFEEAFAARGKKTLVAVANPFMASAAYWIACACEEIYLIPSGQAGSVGVYTMHEDISRMLDAAGIDITFIQYGEHKTEGNAYEPLSDGAHAEFQNSVNYYGQLFDAAVAKGRDVSTSDVRANFGQGRVLRAPDAKKVGMVNKIATLDEVLAKFAPKRVRGLSADAPAAPLTLHDGDVPVATATQTDGVDPNTDGSCPDGYEKGDDGLCYMAATDAASTQLQSDADAIAVTLALSE